MDKAEWDGNTNFYNTTILIQFILRNCVCVTKSSTSVAD